MVFECIAVNFLRKSGKIKIMVENCMPAQLKMWALFNTKENTDTIIFRKSDGKVLMYYEGNKDFPKFSDDNKENLGNIEDYCKGLLAEVQE